MTACRLLPQGAFPLLPTVLTTMAWLASLFQDDCDYSRVKGDIVAQIATSPETPWLEVGIQGYREPKLVDGGWEVTYTGLCLGYPEDYVNVNDDAMWKATTAFSFLALVLGGGGTFFLWFSTCCTFSRGTWRFAGYEIFLASIFQACSFVFFRTDLCQENTCELFWGSRSDIMAAVFWFTASLCIFCYYPPPQEEDDEADGIMVDSNNNSGTADEVVPPFSTSFEETKEHVELSPPSSPTPMESGQASHQESSEANVV